MGIGDGGWGIGAQSPIPNPQSPIPNPHKLVLFILYHKNQYKINKLFLIFISINIYQIYKILRE